jgi:hypothetical protein
MTWLNTRWRRIAAVIAGLVAAYGIIGVFAIPAATHWAIETVATRELGRNVRVEAVKANPYTLRVNIKGLAIDGLPGETTPLLTVREATVNASITSLLHLAPVLDAVAIDGLTVNVARLEPERFNFSGIVERLQAKPKKSDEPARFALNNIEVTGSTVNFDDRVVGARHAVTEIRIGIPFLSNLPSDTEIRVQPAFAARIDGSPLELKGETRPFHESLESSIVVKLDGLDIPKYLAFSPVKLGFQLDRGTLDTDLRIAFRQAVPARAERPARSAQTLISGTVQVNDLAMSAPAGAAAARLLAWKKLAVTIEEFEPLQRRLILTEVAAEAPDVVVVRDSQGTINWVRVAQQPVQSKADASDAKEPPPAPTEPKPLAVTFRRATVRDGKVKLVDDSVGGFMQELVNLQVDASDLTTASADRGRLKLATDIKDNGAVSIDGELGLAPLAGRLAYAARGVRLAVAGRYLAQVVNGTLDGRSDVDGTLEIGRTETGLQLALRDIALVGKDIKVRGPAGGGAALDIAAVRLAGGVLDFTGRTFAIDKLSIDAPRAVVRRLSDGSINWMQVVKAQPAARDASPTAKTATVEAAPSPWTIRVKEAGIDRGDLVLEDVSVEPAVKLRASALRVTAKNLVADGSEPAEFSLRTRFGSGGTLAANGSARWDALAATVRIDARSLDIAALRPYAIGRLNAVLAKAELSARGTATVERHANESSPRIAYKGSARLANLHALDATGESDLLQWQVLDVQGIDAKFGEAAPFVELAKVTLSDFYARVIVSAQGRLNLADLVRREGTDAGRPEDTPDANRTSPAVEKAAAEPPPAATAAPPEGAPSPTIRIGAIEIVRGNVNFTDNFIRPNYTANMTGLGGTVTTLASDSTEPATMALAGKIDDDAPLEISGRLNPLAPALFLDIEGRTKGVDLPRMTPYSVKYAGYPITKGKLSMDVKYKVEAQKLEASNHLFIDQLTFGEKVESPTATKLPVLLAVSLLTNARGEIDINLPISGSLNDPKFSVGGLIVQVIVNLLTKIVTAPFAALASAFGGGEELGYVDFPAGLATLDAAQTKRLDTLAKALNDRPSLKLDIIGRVEPTADAEGVRQAKFNAKLRAAKMRQLTRSGGDSVDPATVKISDQERPALVAAVYSDEKIPDKPRNFIGIAKTIPVAEMEQLILKNLAATPDDLRVLANARAAAVRNRLETNGKVARDRLFLVEPKLTADGIKDKGPPTRVDFALK